MNAGKTLVRAYDNPKDFEKDATGLDVEGWHIVDVTKWTQKAGPLAAFFIRWYRLARPCCQQLVVSYSKDASPGSHP